MELRREQFGEGRKGDAIVLFTLKNDNGIVVKTTNFGGIITAIEQPGRNGRVDNIVLGFDTFETYNSEQYIAGYPYFGALCGRYANRIAKGAFSIEGKNYRLAVNNGPNHLHGGNKGFDRKVWKAVPFEREGVVGVVLSYLSPDGEEGYPGNLDVSVEYSLNNSNELGIRYSATTDRATPVNLTNHTYFNLTGGKAAILGHNLGVWAAKYTPTDDTLIPLGVYKEVGESVFDFRRERLIGAYFDQLPEGYDVNYVLDGEPGVLRRAALLSEPVTGRMVEVLTTQPGLQLYTGHYIPEIDGKFGRYSGVALETQHFPDSPNRPEFPDTILHPGEQFNEVTVYRFGLR